MLHNVYDLTVKLLIFKQKNIDRLIALRAAYSGVGLYCLLHWMCSVHALIVLYSYATRNIKNARHMTLYCVVEHDCPSTIY